MARVFAQTACEADIGCKFLYDDTNWETLRVKITGRDRDIRSLRRTQRAAAVGRLLLGELKSWNEFLQPEITEFETFGRRDLKAGKAKFRAGVSKEIKKFCSRNFQGMTEAKLEKLYLGVKTRRGLEMPLSDFETEFAALKEASRAGAPQHCTVVISLWGLQTKFPEDILSKDVVEAVRQLRNSDIVLQQYQGSNHRTLIAQRGEIQAAVRMQDFASRTCLLACFNLVEASLNGLAWDFSRDAEGFDALSEKKKKLVKDGVFRDKLIKYPEIIAGQPLWDEQDNRVRSFLDQIKPYRDALVHASPFSRPERYGGIDKLEHIYRIDSVKAQNAASLTVMLLIALFRHVRGDEQPLPKWLETLTLETMPRK